MMKFTELNCYKLTQNLQQIHQKLIETSTWSASISSEMYELLLEKLLDLADSPHGFIGTTLRDEPISEAVQFQVEFSTTFDWINSLKNSISKTNSVSYSTFFEHLLQTKNPIFFSIHPNDLLTKKTHKVSDDLQDIKSFLGLPILQQNEVIGWVGILSKSEIYVQEEINFLQPFLVTSALVIHQLKVHQKCEKSHSENQGILAKQSAEKLAFKQKFEEQSDYIQKLERSRNQFNTILETIEDVIWSSGADFSFYINHAAKELYGYELTDFEQNNNLWFECIHPEDKSDVSEKLSQLAVQEYLEAEYRILRKDKAERYVRTRMWFVKDKKGQFLHLDGITSDMTSTILAERDFFLRLGEEVAERTAELQQKSLKLEKANQNVKTSIKYARRLQNAILPDLEEMKEYLTDIFVYYMPRDIVSGDFYWFGVRKNKIFISVIDCTGHGVPGAFMSMMGYALLNEIVLKSKITETNQIIETLNQNIQVALRQRTSRNNDGMDMAICMINKSENKMEFAGARNCLLYFEDTELHLLKGTRKSVGGLHVQKKEMFDKQEVELTEGQIFYLYSDGYPDQLGSFRENQQKRRFMNKRFRKLLTKIHQEPLGLQADILDQTLIRWIGAGKRVDDVTVLGFKI